MGDSTNKQKGFMLVEGLLAVFVIGVVGAGGYYIWSQDNSSEEASIATTIGRVEKIHPDCGPDRYLDADGNAKTSNAKSYMCDGGDYITVDGISYQTSSGLIPTGFWSRDIGNINPGDRVEIKAITKTYDEHEYRKLSCDSCYVRKI